MLVVGQRYRVRIKLNDAGSVFPAGHRVRLALSTAYWPMIWPSPEKATLLISGGTLDLPVRPPQPTDALLPPLPGPESAPPEKPTIIRQGDVRIERIDRIGLESGTENKSRFDIEEDDPLSAVAELRRTQTMSRDAWQIRIEPRDAAVMHTRCLPTAGKSTRLGRRERSLSSRMEALYSSRFHVTARAQFHLMR